MLHDVDGGPILRKLRHPAPALDAEIDPAFHSPFVPAKHEDQMRKDLDLSHLDPNLQEKIYAIIKKYWSVFDEKGVFVPVKNYECVIDTGTARPISVKKILYGERETIIMRKCIAALAKVGHIVQTTEGEWMFKALLAAKPHQEHIRCIDELLLSTIDIVNKALQRWKDCLIPGDRAQYNRPDTMIPLSKERLDMAAYTFSYHMKGGCVWETDPFWGNGNVRETLLRYRFEEHSFGHSASCFKKDCECRFLFPFMSTKSTYIHEDKGDKDQNKKVLSKWISQHYISIYGPSKTTHGMSVHKCSQ